MTDKMKQKYPNIQKDYPNGVMFDHEGYPNFSPYAKVTVKVEGMIGDTRLDFAAATREAGLTKIPDGYTWHHHQDGVTMLMVPKDIHQCVGHTGGAAILRDRIRQGLKT